MNIYTTISRGRYKFSKWLFLAEEIGFCQRCRLLSSGFLEKTEEIRVTFPVFLPLFSAFCLNSWCILRFFRVRPAIILNLLIIHNLPHFRRRVEQFNQIFCLNYSEFVLSYNWNQPFQARALQDFCIHTGADVGPPERHSARGGMVPEEAQYNYMRSVCMCQSAEREDSNVIEGTSQHQQVRKFI